MKFFFIILLLFVVPSCGLKKNFNYLQGDNSTLTLNNYTFKIKSGDALGIKVFGSDQESLDLFNIPGSQLQVQNLGVYNPNLALNSYIVDNDGFIDFPVIGKIKISNLNLLEVSELIKSKVKNYISEPKVNIQVLNFKISVLGDVVNPGTFFISADKISLLEAISLAGDLNITAKRTNLLLVRFENGIYKEHRVDLTKKDFVKSDVFYLQQNDIIYIEANQAKINSSKVSSSWSIAITLASLVITTLNLISR
jgi:polysaccharide export outer membrane protein